MILHPKPPTAEMAMHNLLKNIEVLLAPHIDCDQQLIQKLSKPYPQLSDFKQMLLK